MSEKYLDSQDQLRDEACAFSAQQRAFDAGAHQAMQETRLEIALNLIKQVASEENSAHLLNTAVYVEKEFNAFRQRNR